MPAILARLRKREGIHLGANSKSRRSVGVESPRLSANESVSVIEHRIAGCGNLLCP